MACFEATPPREKRPARKRRSADGDNTATQVECSKARTTFPNDEQREKEEVLGDAAAAVWFCNPDLPRYVTRSYVAAQPLFSPQPRMSN